MSLLSYDWQSNKGNALSLTALQATTGKALVSVACLSSVSSDTWCTLTHTRTCTCWTQSVPLWNHATGISLNLPIAVRTADQMICRKGWPYPYNIARHLEMHWPWFLVNDQRDAQFFSMHLFLFSTLYMFWAHRVHHQERQIVSIQPLIAVTLCRWPCRVQVGSSLPTAGVDGLPTHPHQR